MIGDIWLLPPKKKRPKITFGQEKTFLGKAKRLKKIGTLWQQSIAPVSFKLLPKIEKLKLVKIWETDKLWQNFSQIQKV